jgi:hypothetical protein
MNSVMSIDDGTAAPAAPVAVTRLMGLRVVLIVAALFEAHEGSMTFSAVFGSHSHRTQGLGDALITAHVVSHPWLAAAALVFALIGRVRDAIIAMAAIAAMNWLSELPAVLLHGPELHGAMSVLLTTSYLIVYPLLAGGALVLAARGERLGLATGMAALPTLLNIVGVIAFAVAFSIHGF